jgi:O-antigen/teichoic acid export membrane protein
MAGQGWHLVTAFLLYAYLARALGPTLFGEWTVVLSVLSWVEIFVASALVKVTTKALSESPDEAPHLSRSVYLGQIIVSLVVFLAAQVAAGPIALALGNVQLTPLIRIAALDVPLYAVFMAASSIVLGRQRYAKQGVAWIVYASAKAAFIAGFVWAGLGIQGALVGNALSSLAGLVAMYSMLGGARERFSALWPTLRWMVLASMPFLALSLIQGVAQYVDLWIVSAVVPSAEHVGFYASATVLAEIPVFLFLGLNRVIFPSISSARAQGEGDLADDYTTQSIRTAVIVTVLAVAFIAAAGRHVIELIYSAAFLRAYLPVALLMLAGTGRTIHATCAEILMARDRRTAALTLLGVMVVVEGVLVALAARRYGIDGAAAATALSMLGGAAVAVVLLRSSVGWRPLATLVRALVAAALVGGALAMLPLSPLTVVIALPVVCIAYFGLLWILREFSVRDMAAMRAALGR